MTGRVVVAGVEEDSETGTEDGVLLAVELDDG